MQALPPTRDAERHADREEVVQEAWLAHLSERSPARAVNTFARRERRRQRREITAPTGSGNPGDD